MPPPPTKLPLEVAVFSGANAIQAQHQGVQRVELNAPGSYFNGGLTPPIQEFASVAKWLRIPVRIMIRPVGAPLGAADRDFRYTNAQFAAMKRSIAEFKDLGAMNPFRGDGFVFGILRSAPQDHIDQDESARVAIDIARCTELINVARPFPCIFHRAFDPIADTKLLHQGLEDLVVCGFEGVLTSGGTGSHDAHLDRLDAIMCHLAAHERLRYLQVIVGGGVRSRNAGMAVAKLGTHVPGTVWLHSACLTNHPNHENLNDIELRDLMACLELSQPD